MLTKVMLFGVLFATAPVYLTSSQNPGSDQEPLRDGLVPLVDEFEPLDNFRSPHAARIEDLERQHESEIAELQAQLAESRARVADLDRQLGECMEFLMAPPERHNSCKPSRRLITHYRWFHRNGHAPQAKKTFDRVVDQFGKSNSNLNRTAWKLMTDNETSGEYDDVALALAERMEKNGSLDHRQLDTVALAKFLNGKTEEAIALQKRAIKAGGRDSDYCRRLRTYETALKQQIAQPSQAVATEPKAKISED